MFDRKKTDNNHLWGLHFLFYLPIFRTDIIRNNLAPKTSKLRDSTYVSTNRISVNTPDMRHSKTFFTSDERGFKIVRNGVFDYHLSQVGRQMANKNSISSDFYLRSSIVLTFSIAAYPMW